MVTIKDIAKIAGVSPSTVSRSLNDYPNISQKTKEKIKKIAEELGFEFNEAARSLNKKKTNTIGVIIPQFFDDMRGEIFFANFLGKLIKEAQVRGYHVRIEYEIEKKYIKKMIQSRSVDGLLLMNPEISKEDIEFILEKKFPYIFLHYLSENYIDTNVNYVRTDQEKGGYIATKYLIEKGSRKILTLSGLSINYEFIERTNGYKKAIEEYKIDKEYILDIDVTFESAKKAIHKNKKLLKEIDAIFAQTDLMALGVIEALNELNIKIPEDISIIGFDNIQIGTYFKPRLTTIEQPIGKLARIGIKKLIELMEKNTNVKKFIDPKLIIRESA
ncbi:transcriptional regulator, LacI family [Marinitoga hydrogenitolerans DSM 16785]|uniref:Transcriptional regulator, LacI family n=1 Tax=Marinitoga hydrogenitolerans (strain DSM 16785 / JCM 12826 / AT1271) TaxID=1122195 RepID=A0A1M4UTL5_MARH1|nr:LacI family DNA-binding transcriptional regulator [Marinitoga hydrogenitolerans]SHE60008.1 transcriptional regulator, LacI family [Marinitoga hydrogenitolerans DSM 16785]